MCAAADKEIIHKLYTARAHFVIITWQQISTPLYYFSAFAVYNVAEATATALKRVRADNLMFAELDRDHDVIIGKYR